MHSSVAIVDRSGWDQTFVDSGGGNPLCSSSASAVRTDTDVDSVSLATCNLLGSRTCRSVVDDVSQPPPPSTLSSTRSVDHRVHELVMEQLHRSIRTSTSPTSVVNCTDSSSNSSAVPTSLSKNCDVLQRSHLLPPCVETSTDTSPGLGALHQSHSASLLCPVEASSPGLMSDPFSSGPVSPMVLSDASSSFGPSDFHSYENAPNSKSRTFSVAPGQFSTTSVPASTCSVSVDPAATSAFDFSWPPPSNWIPATALDCTGGVGSVRGVPRHSSSAVSDFVGSSTAGSPTPFLNINSSIEVCRSSSSPFGRSGLNSGSGSGGSQSDSGCSDGGGDSAGDGHFRYSGGPSPIVDDFRSAAVDVVSRQRNGIVQPLPVRDLPAPALPLLYSRIVSFLPSWDAERLELAYSRLAISGFYYGRMTIDEAADRLRKTAVGTFLVRDSSDDRFVFSISVQTCRGTTSIRVAFRSGLFRLDCNPEQEHLMPTFDCVLRLLRHYVRLCRRPVNPASGATKASYVLLETSGRRDTPVLLREPLHARVTSLAHACRRTIHAALSSHNPNGGYSESDRAVLVDRLQLMPTLKRYLKDYPYDL